ncbi:hypothetical protein BDV06DRAFT_92163 [Aspergillus oleicola]
MQRSRDFLQVVDSVREVSPQIQRQRRMRRNPKQVFDSVRLEAADRDASLVDEKHRQRNTRRNWERQLIRVSLEVVASGLSLPEEKQ